MTIRIKDTAISNRRGWLWAALLLLTLPLPAITAELSMPSIFSDRMVLQREMPVPVWGTAEPGERVDVSFHGQEFTARADARGKWRIKMPPMKAGGPFEMTVKSQTTSMTFKDVFLGEVWLAAGQSNMAFRFKFSNEEDQAAALAILDKHHLRMYQVPKIVAGGKLLDRHEQPWAVADQTAVDNWSAVAVYFSQALHLQDSVVIGIIDCSQGSSTIEAWMSADAIADAKEAGYIPAQEFEDIRRYYRNPTVLHQSMLSTIVPYAIRGVLWYQGESNSADAASYKILLPTLIASWREMWQQEELPFLFAQLPAYEPPTDDTGKAWALFRAAQAEVNEAVPGTGMAVLVDTGEADNIHPADKKIVGDRLANIARAQVYGESIAYLGPSIKRIEYRGAAAVIEFHEADSGLIVKGDSIQGFSVKGGDNIWLSADAELRDNKVVVYHPKGLDIIGVRYGWSNAPQVNLYNRHNYPAVPFSVTQ